MGFAGVQRGNGESQWKSLKFSFVLLQPCSPGSPPQHGAVGQALRHGSGHAAQLQLPEG